MRMSKRLVALLIIALFLFQLASPLIQIGIAHTPPECKKLREEWKEKSDKHVALILELEELRNSRAWTIAKEAFLDATIGGLLNRWHNERHR